MSQVNDKRLHPFVNRVEWEPDRDTPGLMCCFDEMVTGPVDAVMIERMSDDCIWMSIRKGGKRQIVTFGTRRGALVLARTEGE